MEKGWTTPDVQYTPLQISIHRYEGGIRDNH